MELVLGHPSQETSCKIPILRQAAFSACSVITRLFQISWMCMTQSAVSHSSAEPEVVSLDIGVPRKLCPTFHPRNPFRCQSVPNQPIHSEPHVESADVAPKNSLAPTLSRMIDLCLRTRKRVIRMVIEATQPGYATSFQGIIAIWICFRKDQN